MNDDNEMRHEYSRAVPYIAPMDGLSSAGCLLSFQEYKQPEEFLHLTMSPFT